LRDFADRLSYVCVGGETHWHGATNGTLMAHLAISLGSKSSLRTYMSAQGGVLM